MVSTDYYNYWEGFLQSYFLSWEDFSRQRFEKGYLASAVCCLDLRWVIIFYLWRLPSFLPPSSRALFTGIPPMPGSVLRHLYVLVLYITPCAFCVNIQR